MNWFRQANQVIQISHSGLVSALSTGDPTKVSNFLYKAITTHPGWQQSASQLTPEIKQQYIAAVSSASASNPAWAQWNVQKGLPQESGNYKLYFTPSDEDISKVLSGIGELFQYLQPVSESYQSNLDYKIPTTATAYLGHNDRIVVHFSKKEAARDIQGAVQQWANANGISFGNRTHTMGADSQEKVSWGQSVANTMSQYAIQYLASGKYNAEQIARWVETYIGDVLNQLGKQTV
tara:strand:- start:315 stop:1019 length:705 start_codon:yes stop_codon:yes gene_type:complete